MAKTIVLPLDGTPESERAIAYAQALAQRLVARIVLVRGVLAAPVTPSPVHPPREIQEAGLYLAVIAEQLRRAGIEVERLVINDEGGWAVVTVAAEQSAGLVVMATHARGVVARSLLGSIADRVVRDGPAPVLLVPPHAAFNWPPPHHPMRIIVGLDGSALSERVLVPVAEIARATQGEITLVHAVQAPIAIEQQTISEIYQLAPDGSVIHEGLIAASKRLEALGLRVALEERLGSPAEVIHALARERGAHVVALTTHGRSGLSRLVMGSVAEAVVGHASIPVLVCGPHAVLDDQHTPHEPRRGSSQSA